VKDKHKKVKEKKVIPDFGYLYPSITAELLKCNSLDLLREKLICYPQYYNLVKDLPDPKKPEEFSLQHGLKSIDDVMFEESIKRYSIAFEQQFHYGCFYAYIKIKEQEIKNIMWFSDLSQVKKDKDSQGKLAKNYIVPFNY